LVEKAEKVAWGCEDEMQHFRAQSDTPRVQSIAPINSDLEIVSGMFGSVNAKAVQLYF
jgi:hypothetical protein